MVEKKPDYHRSHKIVRKKYCSLIAGLQQKIKLAFSHNYVNRVGDGKKMIRKYMYKK